MNQNPENKARDRIDKMLANAGWVVQSKNDSYPRSLTTKAKRALYDNLDGDEVMALALDNLIQSTKLDDWRDGGIREKKLMLAVKDLIKDQKKTDELMKIIKAQDEY